MGQGPGGGGGGVPSATLCIATRKSSLESGGLREVWTIKGNLGPTVSGAAGKTGAPGPA